MVLDLPLYTVPLGKLKPDLRSTSCQAKLCRIVGFLVEALAGTMDPFLVLIAVIVIGISLISRSSEEWFFFDLFSGSMFDSNYSTNRTNFEFNGLFYVLLTAVVLAGGCLLFSTLADDQPKRVFIPVKDRKTTVAPAHLHRAALASQHTSHRTSSSHNATTAIAHKALPHKAIAQSKH